jgi:hypothetical protein
MRLYFVPFRGPPVSSCVKTCERYTQSYTYTSTIVVLAYYICASLLHCTHLPVFE